MSTLSQFVGSKPIRTVTYTSGSGSFTPLVSNSLCRVTIVGGGGGGRRGATTTAGGGGGAGETKQILVRLTGSQTYQVGAAGTGATADNTNGVTGGSSKLGALFAMGGQGGGQQGSSSAAFGGGGQSASLQGLDYSGGYGGGPGNPGSSFGYPSFVGTTVSPQVASAGATVTNGGGGGGGSSVYGLGGNGGNGSATAASTGSAGAGYGAGGGGGGGGSTSGNGGNGTGGLIIIEEFGA